MDLHSCFLPLRKAVSLRRDFHWSKQRGLQKDLIKLVQITYFILNRIYFSVAYVAEKLASVKPS